VCMRVCVYLSIYTTDVPLSQLSLILIQLIQKAAIIPSPRPGLFFEFSINIK